jgi:DNA-directed RNA polymerase beta' subunit
LILGVLPVIPPISRPYLVSDSKICDDDLTYTYNEIIKINKCLADTSLSEIKRQKNIQNLLFRIKTLFDNSQGKSKHTNSRSMKGIKERIVGKEGIIRGNLMGKRVNFSARTVIGPDPTLRLNEIAIPNEIADALSYPENVNKYNIEKLQRLVWDDGANTVLRGSTKFVLKYALKGNRRYNFILLEGDVVERKLQDGDIILSNRQPTLHKGGMMAHRIIRRPGKTIRLNLAVTASYNADFDGDEMNLHTASSEMSRAELEYLSDVKYNIMGTQASKPNIRIVQDCLLATYLMTKNNDPIPRHVFLNICMKMDFQGPSPINWDIIQSRLDAVKEVWDDEKTELPLYCGKSLVSIILPWDFNYISNNKSSSKHPVLKITRGVIWEGAITKLNIGSSHQSIIKILHKEYPLAVVEAFINNIQFIANEYMLYHGFSVGIKDCLGRQSNLVKQEIKTVITKCFVEAESIENTNKNLFIKEARINMALGKAKDIGMKMAKDSLHPDNSFFGTVMSGSKGDFFNISQIMGLLGQQNITGRRVKPNINNGQRTLSHYPLDAEGKLCVSKEIEYESRGFISNSFIKGLNPREFWFHAMSGREGITDTALKTAHSGYTTRRMTKIMEDVQVKYDKTVRNSVGSIIQFVYGDDNLCGNHTSLLKSGEDISFNVARIVNKLNLRVSGKK